MRSRLLFASASQSTWLLRSAALAVVLLGGSAAMADTTATVAASLAPNAFGSSYWNDYVTNALSAQESSTSTAGDSSLPSYYSQVPNGANIPAGDFIVTGFNSWRGDANPGTDYGAAYANEYGNRLTYDVDIRGNGSKISISELSFKALYNDASNTNYVLDEVDTGADGYDYDSTHIGINYGPDGIRGTADDQIITSGDPTTPVDEIIDVSTGLGYAVYSTDDGATNQDKIDNWLTTNFGNDPYSITGEYYMDGDSVGSTTQNFNAVPEPASLSFLAGGAVLLMRRRKGAARSK